MAKVIGISGIDGSGKTTKAREMKEKFQKEGKSVKVIHVDDWIDEYAVNYRNPLYFYAIVNEAVNVAVDNIDLYQSEDIIIVEGICLFTERTKPYFDEMIWIDCEFDMALGRALKRNQEGVSPDQLYLDYKEVYHAAQHIYLAFNDVK